MARGPRRRGVVVSGDAVASPRSDAAGRSSTPADSARTLRRRLTVEPSRGLPSDMADATSAPGGVAAGPAGPALGSGSSCAPLSLSASVPLSADGRRRARSCSSWPTSCSSCMSYSLSRSWRSSAASSAASGSIWPASFSRCIVVAAASRAMLALSPCRSSCFRRCFCGLFSVSCRCIFCSARCGRAAAGSLSLAAAAARPLGSGSPATRRPLGSGCVSRPRLPPSRP